MFLVNGTLEEFSIKTPLFLKLDYFWVLTDRWKKAKIKKQTDASWWKKRQKKMLNHNLENSKGCSVNTVSDRQFRGVIKYQKNEEKWNLSKLERVIRFWDMSSNIWFSRYFSLINESLCAQFSFLFNLVSWRHAC